MFGIERPTVGLLNVGVEEIKGQEEVKEAGRLLREANLTSLDYHGFVEGDDIGKGTVDVVVTEGFAGNIALKTAEGTARQIGEYLRAAMSRTLMARIGYVFAQGAFERLREKMDVRKANGGVFLGLNGIVVKSHGGADEEGFAAAIDLGYDMVRNRLIERIKADLETFHARQPQIAAGKPPLGPSKVKSREPNDQIRRARGRLRAAQPHHEECRFRRHGRDRRTTGLRSAPASASAISPATARPRPRSARQRPARRWPMQG